MNRPLSVHDVTKPTPRAYDLRRYLALKADGCCVRCSGKLRLAEIGKYTRCRLCRVIHNASAERSAKRISSRRNVGGRPLGVPNDPDTELTAGTRAARVALDVDAGLRCGRCHLLNPCLGHETMSLEWNAARRHGESAGE